VKVRAALTYFVREALLNMARGWRVSLLAVLTIAVSLFVGGVFLQVSANLRRIADDWRREAKIVVYVLPEAGEQERAEVLAAVRAAVFVERVTEVDSATARERFREVFPSMSDLLEGWDQDPLPPSFEVSYLPVAADDPAFRAWLEKLRALPAVSLVDDDRDWLGQLETFSAVVRGAGMALCVVLLGAAIFTIASVIRLTAYLYSEEIAILRLVGGTEFYIRGPFYFEGLFQGLAGGALAVGALVLTVQILHRRAAESIVAWFFAGESISPALLGGIMLVGALAGLVGAVVSLRNERFRQPES
jgi:cell division transport system permease protein